MVRENQRLSKELEGKNNEVGSCTAYEGRIVKAREAQLFVTFFPC